MVFVMITDQYIITFYILSSFYVHYSIYITQFDR